MSRHISLDAHLVLFTNDSDDNDANEDFVSFPTLPDPDTVANRSISTIISKTLRKVTNNASNLVHTYASPHQQNDAPNDMIDSLSIYSRGSRIPKKDLLADIDSDSVSKLNDNLIHQGSPAPVLPVSAPSRTSTVVMAAPSALQSRTQTQLSQLSALEPAFDPMASTAMKISPLHSSLPSIAPIMTQQEPTTAKQSQISDVSGTASPQVDFSPKVTSDNRFLRISTMQPSKLPAFLVSKNEVTVVNTDPASAPQETLTVRDAADLEGTKVRLLQSSHSDGPNSKATLQKRISSIFNNLPNDIEVSDDSASDLETLNNDSISSITNQSTLRARLAPVKSSSKNTVSPAKVNSKPASISRTSETNSISTINSLKGKSPLTRKISSNFSSAIIGGAKSIMNTNLGGVSSSATSLESFSITLKKKKKLKKPRKLSDNPLKNGGIPKKYWMNDSFVSECVNCFRPFTAFRRKHHCRFCGQIFCSTCTMFISYTQYKQQRRSKDGAIISDSKSYNDRLRVCKPCYGDVIVYLSDDSLLSSSENEEEQEEVPSKRYDSESDEMILPEHPLSRFRSHSTNSRRNSIAFLDSPQNSNKAFLKNPKESPKVAASASTEPTPRSPEVIPYKQAPQMAIPTTRAGESVEIQIPTQKPMLGTLPLKSNLVMLAMKNAASSNLHSSGGNSESSDSKPGSWFNLYSHHNSSSSDVGNSNGLDNLGALYKAVSRYGRIASSSENRGLITNSPEHQNEIEDDVGSESEDEQAMSLYTSLNHVAANQATMSPRVNTSLSSSLVAVPTLHEFPTMVLDDKYLPTDFSQGGDLKRIEFKNMDSMHTINANKRGSDYRSNERAMASLRRIRTRRTNKGRKAGLGAHRLHPLDPGLSSSLGNGSSPLSTPTSPTPKTQASYFYGSSVPRRSNSNSGLQLKRELLPSTPSTPGPSDVDIREITQVLNYSLDHQHKDMLRSHLSDPDLDNYFNSFEPSLDESYDRHFRRIINQCLEDCDIKDETEKTNWLNVLHRILLNINRIEIGDTLDVKQYVKIKKIFGGSVDDTSIIDGLFITKNIDSKRMRSHIDNPKIALLMFPVEYLKQKEQFISLRIVNSQQAVYISNLVSRLVSLEPDIIVVGDTVCGLAERLLEEANITVISNMKPQVIERISRYTKGDIFQSVNDLFFKKVTLGTCGRFEVKRFLYNDTVKTYSFFTGSEIESGFTICLRGGDEELLGSAKYAAESMVPGVFNARFEKQLFRDLSLVIEGNGTILNSNNSVFEQLQTLIHQDGETSDEAKVSCIMALKNYGIIDYIELFEKRVLSDSPAVQFTLPKALNNVVSAFKAYVEFCDFNKMLQQLQPNDEFDNGWLQKLNFDLNLERFNGKEDVLDILKFVGTERARRLLLEFNFRTRIWSNSMKYPIYQLYPIFHKSINFLHSTVSIKHATPCYGPVVVGIDYYTEKDKCLGMFLDQILQDSNNVCEECGELMLDHYKTYAHDNAKLDIIVERVENASENEASYKGMDQRVMWSYCPECNISTPITAMSDESYYLSLGKFLELSFWAKNVNYYKDCPHDYFKEHIKYFGVRDLVIRIEYGPIDTYEVVVPSKKHKITLETDIKLKLESFEHIQKSARAFFESVSQRLNRVKLDTFDKAEAGRQKVEELKSKLLAQEEFVNSKSMTIYSSTSPTDYLSLNVIQRDLQELGVAWDNEFNDFEHNFLPTENEITKITQFHLRNFLIDKLEDSDMKEPCEEDDQKNAPEQAHSESKEHELKDENTSNTKGQATTMTDVKDYLTLTSRMRVPLSIIEDKILQFKQSFENDQKQVSRSPTKTRNLLVSEGSENNAQVPNRVQDLTNYFNQMTLEFQRQREEELEKKSNNYKAIPIANSKPIVEMYDNIEDVVDVNPKNGKREEYQKPSIISPVNSIRKADKLEDNYLQTLLTPQISPTEQSVDVILNAELKKDTQKGLKEQSGKQGLEIPQPERISLLKSLTSFWADRSATLWEPLEYSLDFTEHTFADSDVIVREDEPSSLVAFCLSTSDYEQKIKKMATDPEESNDNLENNEQYVKKLSSFTSIERKFKKKFAESDNEMSELEAIMTKTKSTHLKYQFIDGNTDLSCKIFYSEQFEALRKACGVNESFVQSLSRCVKWNSKGGKSGSNFLKTLDNRYILKELSKSELESFVSTAPFYFKYISQSTFNTLTTALAKIFGFYQVEIKNSINGKTFKMDFLIMENLFYNRTTTRIFDLKGSMRNRHVKQTGKENEVLLDENMIEYIYESPVFVREHSKKLLRGSLFNDTSFLCAMDVMDYSLVVGIDDSSHKLYVGIIDWLRTFTWDKKVENWMKGNSLVVKKGKDPTIVTPKQYRTRFREAMNRYILEVPDIWYEGN